MGLQNVQFRQSPDHRQIPNQAGWSSTTQIGWLKKILNKDIIIYSGFKVTYWGHIYDVWR